MKNEAVNKDKILKHINYTKYWLDKAIKEYTAKSVTAGNLILNIARAELTTAWEEAQEIKKYIIPKRKSREWKTVSSLSMLASGFIVALLLFHFTNPYNLSDVFSSKYSPSPVKNIEKITTSNETNISTEKTYQNTLPTSKIYKKRYRRIKNIVTQKRLEEITQASKENKTEVTTEQMQIEPIIQEEMKTQIPIIEEKKEASELGKMEAIELLKAAEKALKE